MFQKLEGIVLRSIDYGESNKILTIFSREKGKVGAVARGAKKPNSRLASVSQPFTYGYFLCSIGSGLGTVQQGENIDSFRTIKEDLFLTAYSAYIVELLEKGTEEKVVNPFLFELLYQTLKHISEGYDPKIIKNIFEIKMLSVLGFRPILTECAVCGNPDGPFAFSVKEGGIICPNCYHKDPYHLKVQQATIRLLKLFYYIDITRIGSINVKELTKKELNQCITAYYEEYSGIYLKSKKFLLQMEELG
ncbi:DNA repair protein RecO [Caldibacillus lycopersici]|uniref:DNA repair protein RecO n=1 Tax=Perspicuibacillus lycopersici TaxID=1325689 RepID=A0AAE3IV17_9BACI|nr:DNA repair protein RecO [Perspicuibacillus lycopersici]MCU9613911.1 DNA repair protein RecO [Perspicuibacillus lycopersici]